MKTIFRLAAVATALAGASGASAHDNGDGHWEGKSRPTFGPNKSNLPSQVRVWIKDGNPEMADCMMDMPDKLKAPSAG